MKTIITTPKLEYPFPDHKNPLAEKIELQADFWLQNDYQALPDEFHRKKEIYRYGNTFVGHMCARMYPFASYEQSIPIVRFLLWGLSNDDLYEDCTASELQTLRERAVAVLRGYQLLPSDNELFRQLQIQRLEMLTFMSSNWMERYTRAIDTGFEGMLLEAPYKRAMLFPSVADYMAIREKAVLVYPLVCLVELQTGVSFPDEIAYHPIMQRIAALTCRILAWTNDYFSVAKEQGRDVMNLVLVLQHERNITLEEAYMEAIRIHDEDVLEVLNLCSSVPDFGIFNESVSDYTKQLKYLIHGHKKWYELDTKRYIVQ